MSVTKNTTVQVVPDAPADDAAIEAAGVARLAEVVAQLNGGVTDLLTAKLTIIDAIRKIQDEKLWVFARDTNGDAYTDGKSLVNDLLGDALKDWSDDTRRDFILMLVGEGWTAAEAAEVTGTTPRKAANAVKKAEAAANAVFAGTTPEVPAAEVPAPAEGEQAPEGEQATTPPATPKAQETDEQKASKIAAQAIASNKKVLDNLHLMSADDRAKLLIDYNAVVKSLVVYRDEMDNETVAA
jgi:hypothetical protein